VRALVEQAFERASGILTERRGVLETGARRLLEQETLTADELSALVVPNAG
jgi:cell division protease FtsH